MSKKGVVKGGIIGVVLGAIGGILFAPKSGKETRKDLKDAAIKANHEAEKKLKELHVELKEKTEEAKKLADEYSGKAKEEYEELAKRAEFTKQKVSEMITAVREYEADEKEVDSTLSEAKKVVSELAIKAKGGKKAPAKKKPAAKKK